MNSTSEYLLMFRGNDWQKALSPQEIEETLGRFMNWFQELDAQGRLRGSNPLQNSGKLISGTGGHSIVDGPFAESKEAIGGYFVVAVEDEAEAIAIARRCPLLAHGTVVEVRPIAPECPIKAHLETQSESLAHA